METKKRGNRKASYLAVYHFDDLRPLGLFLNTSHVQDCLNIDSGNLTKYLDDKIHSIKDGLVVVRVNRDKNPIDSTKIVEEALPLAEVRKGKMIIARFTNENLQNLSTDKIIAIQAILNQKAEG